MLIHPKSPTADERMKKTLYDLFLLGEDTVKILEHFDTSSSYKLDTCLKK